MNTTETIRRLCDEVLSINDRVPEIGPGKLAQMKDLAQRILILTASIPPLPTPPTHKRAWMTREEIIEKMKAGHFVYVLSGWRSEPETVHILNKPRVMVGYGVGSTRIHGRVWNQIEKSGEVAEFFPRSSRLHYRHVSVTDGSVEETLRVLGRGGEK